MTEPAVSPAACPQTTALSPDAVALPGSKRQPWRDIWPAPREPQQQAQIYGFAKGEIMVFDGNAGNFFARDGWSVEQASDTQSKVTARGADQDIYQLRNCGGAVPSPTGHGM
jgi:hypothetical protein